MLHCDISVNQILYGHALVFDVQIHGAARMVHKQAKVHGGDGTSQVKKNGDGKY